MSRNEIFDLWIGKISKIHNMDSFKSIAGKSNRDFFIENVIRNYLPDFNLNSLKFNDHGKPFIPNSYFSFNLSHSDQYLTILICTQPYCGIDIQEVKDRMKYDDALKSVLTDNEYQVLDNFNNNEKFFQLWSLKEAYVKAMGNSIWFGRDYDFSQILPEFSNEWYACNKLFVYSICNVAENCLSVAVPSKPEKINFIDF